MEFTKQGCTKRSQVTFTQATIAGRHMAAGPGGCSQNPTPITSIFVAVVEKKRMIDLSERRLARWKMNTSCPLDLLIFISMFTCLLVDTACAKALLVMLLCPLMISIVLALNADLDSPRRWTIQTVSKASKDAINANENPVIWMTAVVAPDVLYPANFLAAALADPR